MRAYPFWVRQDLGEGFGLVRFQIVIYAKSETAAAIIAAEIGKQHHMLLLRPT